MGGTKSASKIATNSPVAVSSPACKRPGFIAFAIGAMMILDRKSERVISLHKRFGKGSRVVGRIVQHLYLQQLARVIHPRDLVNQPLDNVSLVVNRQLNRDRRQLRKTLGRLACSSLTILEVSANDIVPVHAINREHHQNSKVRNQNGPIKPTHLIHAGKRVVEQLSHDLRAGRSTCQKCNGKQSCYHIVKDWLCRS